MRGVQDASPPASPPACAHLWLSAAPAAPAQATTAAVPPKPQTAAEPDGVGVPPGGGTGGRELAEPGPAVGSQKRVPNSGLQGRPLSAVEIPAACGAMPGLDAATAVTLVSPPRCPVAASRADGGDREADRAAARPERDSSAASKERGSGGAPAGGAAGGSASPLEKAAARRPAAARRRSVGSCASDRSDLRREAGVGQAAPDAAPASEDRFGSQTRALTNTAASELKPQVGSGSESAEFEVQACISTDAAAENSTGSVLVLSVRQGAEVSAEPRDVRADIIDDLLFAEPDVSSTDLVEVRQPMARAASTAQGVTFTTLLVSTLETGAAAEREGLEQNRHIKESAIREKAARLQWRKENYVPRSLFCLKLDNRLRQTCCMLIEWRWFDRIILSIIATNCIFMAMEDPPNQNEANSYNEMLSTAGIFFQSCFMLEATIKVIARGFLLGKATYLRDWWNVLDFVTVFLGLLEYVALSGSSASALRAFRLLRPLRALRAVGKFKDLRMIVNLIISCLPPLVDVFALISFIFVVFGIIGIQLWGGYLRGRCYDMDTGLLDVANIDNVCSMEGDGGMNKCDASERCLRIYMNPMYNALTFDYIGSVFVIILQVMVQQKWNAIMYYIWDSFSFWSWPYFILLNLVGPMFAVQLFLVVVANQYSNARSQQREAEKAAVELYEVKVGAVTANLPRVSMNGHHLVFDAYVVITVDEKTKKTRVVKSSYVPEWNEYFVFPVSSAASFAKIEIRNWKRQGRHDIIGSLSIPVGTLDQQEEGTDRWYEVCSPEGASMEGSIQIRTQWRLVTSEEWSPLPEIDDEDVPEEEDEEDDDQTILMQMQAALRVVAESRFLTVTSILFICGNMLAMAADHNCDLLEDSFCKTFKAQLEQANLAFTSFFVLEMLVKVWGLCIVSYFKDVSNAFDFLVVVISLAELPSSIAQIRCFAFATERTVETCDAAGGSMSVLRTFRLVRILRLGKLVELFPQIRRQIKVITRTLGAVSSLVVLIVMYLVIFAILGMSLLGGSVTEYLRTTDPDNLNDFRPGNNVLVLVPTNQSYLIEISRIVTFDPSRNSRQYLVYRDAPSNILWPLSNMSPNSILDWQQKHQIWVDLIELEPFQYNNFIATNPVPTIVGLVPRGNFDSFLNAIITVFQIFTTSDLGDAMYPAIRGTGMFASLFFAAQILLGNLLLFNLFTGIIITGFSETKEELQKEEQENQRMIEQDKLRRAQSLARGMSIGSKARSSSGTSISRGMSITSSVAGMEHCTSLENAVEKVKALLLGSNRVTADDLRKQAVASVGGDKGNEDEKNPDNWVFRIVASRIFESAIMFTIFISSLSLAIQRPNMTSIERHISDIADVLIGVIFLLECLLKIKAFGFYRYIGSRWNQLDFFLVLTTWVELLLSWSSTQNAKVSRSLASSIISLFIYNKYGFAWVTAGWIFV